jgi:hypothetical protein
MPKHTDSCYQILGFTRFQKPPLREPSHSNIPNNTSPVTALLTTPKTKPRPAVGNEVMDGQKSLTCQTDWLSVAHNRPPALLDCAGVPLEQLLVASAEHDREIITNEIYDLTDYLVRKFELSPYQPIVAGFS